jgi:hypothetical protein
MHAGKRYYGSVFWQQYVTMEFPPHPRFSTSDIGPVVGHVTEVPLYEVPLSMINDILAISE